MENYELEEDEVVLYKGFVNLAGEKSQTELILTNISFVLITKRKQMFKKEQVQVDTYPVNEIKYYKGDPQVIKKGRHVELYFISGETEFDFQSQNECRKFVDTAKNLITNKNKFERSVEKVKATISMVDNSLGISSVDVAKLAINKGVVGKTVKVIGKTASVVGKGVKYIGKIRKKD